MTNQCTNDNKEILLLKEQMNAEKQEMELLQAQIIREKDEEINQLTAGIKEL